MLFEKKIFSESNETANYISSTEACPEGQTCSYYKHIHFIDFQQFNLTNPIYINLVRDPAQRLMSW